MAFWFWFLSPAWVELYVFILKAEFGIDAFSDFSMTIGWIRFVYYFVLNWIKWIRWCEYAIDANMQLICSKFYFCVPSLYCCHKFVDNDLIFHHLLLQIFQCQAQGALKYFFFIFTARDRIKHPPLCQNRWLKHKLKCLDLGFENKMIFAFPI